MRVTQLTKGLDRLFHTKKMTELTLPKYGLIKNTSQNSEVWPIDLIGQEVEEFFHLTKQIDFYSSNISFNKTSNPVMLIQMSFFKMRKKYDEHLTGFGEFSNRVLTPELCLSSRTPHILTLHSDRYCAGTL